MCYPCQLLAHIMNIHLFASNCCRISRERSPPADPAFRDYLKRLQYWRELPYCLYLVFPHCLRMLDLLIQDNGFVDALKRADFKDYIFAQQFSHWRYRATELGGAVAADTGTAGAAGAEDAGLAGGPSHEHGQGG